MVAGPALSFAELLRRHRLAAGLTQEALAEEARLSTRAISDLERGIKYRPRGDTVQLLADALELSAQERATFARAASRRLVRQQAHARSPVQGEPLPHRDAAPAPFIGRMHERGLLARHLAGEGAPVLLLAGEPGIGKSRLLREAAQHAAGQGWHVLEGGCERRGGQEPYAPLLGALAQHIQHQPPRRLRADLQGCAWLVRLLPELADMGIEPLPSWTAPPEQERRLMFAAVRRFLANVAGPAGTLLLLDDLQWASADALELLATLARSAEELRLRLVGAYRDTEVQPQDPLAIMLADLAHAGLAAHHTLPPLTAEEAGQLLEHVLDGVEDEWSALRERVVQRAGGLPFFVLSCAHALRRDADSGGTADAVPWDAAQSIRQRVAALPGAARDVLGVAAVVGRVVQPPLLMAVVDQTERETLTALEVACRARLLVEQGEDIYAFAHDVIREVVEADLGAPRRRLLHRQVAEALEQWPGEPPVELLAYHYERSGEQDKVVRYLELAGDRARAQYANVAAESYYRELVARLDGLGRVLHAARVREKLGAALATVARYDAALAELGQAAEAYRVAGDVESQARVMAQVGRVHAARATPAEGVARLEPFLAALGARGPSPGQAALYAALAWLFLARGRCAESVVAAERAADLARAVGDDKILMDVEVLRGRALLALGRAEEGLQVLESTLPLVEAGGDLSTLCRALNHIGEMHLLAGAFERSCGYHGRALELAERIGDWLWMMLVLTGLGELSLFWGHWSTARSHLERAVDLGRVGWSLFSGRALLSLARLHLAEGEWATASRYAEECLIQASRTGDLQDIQRLLAECDLLEGRPDAALARLTPLLDHSSTAEIDLTMLLPIVAWAHLEQGEDVEAARLAATGIRHAQAQNNRLALVDALRVQAMVAIRQERWAEAEAALEEGLALAQRMPYPYAEGRLLHVYAEMHALKGEPETARERLEAALALFRRLGARKDVERVEQVLSTLPSVPLPDAPVPARPSLPTGQGGGAGAPAGRHLSRTERQAWAVEHLRTGPLSPRAYATALAVSVDTALRDLQELVDRGLVRAEGTTKNRRYVLTANDRP